MDTYNIIETDQDRIEISKTICSVFQIQDNSNQYVMAEVETNKQV